MIIEIRGVQFVNKGAELMLHAVLEQINQHFPQAQVALAPNKNSPYRQRAALGALQKIPLRFRGRDFNLLSYYLPKKLRQFLTSFIGVVFEADIDLVLDASGFAYGDQWGGRNVTVLCNEIKRLAQKHKGYILLPQAFGPFQREKDRQALAAALPQAWLVCARDQASFRHLSSCLESSNNLYQFADFTNLVKPLSPPELTAQAIAAKRCLIIPNNAMLSAKNHNQQWREHYLDVLKLAIQTAQQQGMTAVLLNHEGQADAALCQQLSQAFSPTLKVVNEADPRVVKGWIATSALVFCSRFHGCVSALSSAVPCIGTSWSHKYEALFSEYQQAEFLIGPDISAAQLQLLFHQAQQKVTTAEVTQAIMQFKQQSEQLWLQVLAVVQQHLPELTTQTANSDKVQ
ncbi:polysaccharide pyruvyl transferase family protein [Rheinheimera sp.]|uniref:polysaccharide pyruvyl transferase family protein n=1 Tax=Rheinheimera sp. TaxID=1869214 RepID=UPI0027B89379|nr:polysaccharide pyruvyl transferase family protein [Rheinheimera sp.]